MVKVSQLCLSLQSFLGNEKAKNFKKIVNEMLYNFQQLGCTMSIQLHYVHSHLDVFPDNLGDFSEEQGDGSASTRT